MADVFDIPSEEYAIPPPSYALALEQGLQEDGRISVFPDSRLVRSFTHFVPDWKRPATPETSRTEAESSNSHTSAPISASSLTSSQLANRPWTLPLNIVIQVVGSRGDVQPFIALGNELQKHGHRVRLATHDVFEAFVTSSNLEFYPIGGDPTELMAYMVKNPGLLPSKKSILAGDIQKKRVMIASILQGCWKSCVEPDRKSGAPFVANAIIANPPSFAHVHCAEALGIPLHLMFTMPWSSTRFFNHPLANIPLSPDISPRSRETLNWVSYAVVEWMTWQGLGDLINDWRLTLDLAPVPFSEGPMLTEKLKIPSTYCWSPAIVPKPADWADHIDVCGFFFRQEPSFSPPDDLCQYLRTGPPPIYVGFGSIVIDNPEKLIQLILAAAEATDVRLIVSRGWSRLGGTRENSDQVFFIDDCPHEWLFQRVAAVVHHGGAGTTACGIRYAKPTFIVPFFGDQFFWGERIASAGAGPRPIPHAKLTIRNLTEAFTFCISNQAIVAATAISKQMSNESGIAMAVESFHKHLPSEAMSCDIIAKEPAVWSYTRKDHKILLSNRAAGILVNHLKIDKRKLELYKPKKILIERNRWDPITGVTSAVASTYVGMVGSITDIVTKPVGIYRTAVREKPKTNSNPHTSDSVAMSSLSDSISTRPKHTSAEVLVTPGGKKKPARGCVSIGGDMVLGAAAGAGGVVGSACKGYFVDVPLAATEGMRNLPRLYGGKVRDYGQVTDWKSGMAVSGKSLGYGLGLGILDLFWEPVHGAKTGGVVGGAKGFGKGVLTLGTNVVVGVLGVVSYPSYGIYKSINGAFHTKTRDNIIATLLAAVNHDQQTGILAADKERVLRGFELLTQKGDK